MTDYLTAGSRHLLHFFIQKGQKSWLLMALLLACCPLFIALILHSCRGQSHAQTPPPRAVRYMVVPPPSPQDMQERVGEIHAHDDVALGFRLSGRLLTRTVNVGDHVKAGQILATLESDTAENQRFSAKAELESARAAEQVAALNLKRMRQLMPSGAISVAQLDSAQADWQAAASKHKSAAANLKIADDNVGWSRLIAPGNGVITAVSASVGQVVSAGESIATLAAGEARDAVFDVASPGEMAPNSERTFSVSLLAAPSVKAQALFRDISPQADTKTRTWRVRLTLVSPPPELALGASVQAVFAGNEKPVIPLPASALTRVAGKPAVFILDNTHQQLVLAPVVLAGFSPTQIFVSEGVAPGNKVVTAGVARLRAGERVSAGEMEQ